MDANQFSRRQFLRGLGNFTLTIPFLPSLLPRSAWAAASTFTVPPFLVFLSSDLGICDANNYFPTIASGSQLKFSMRNALGNYDAYESALPTGNLSNVFSTAFNSQHGNLIVMKGLDYDTNDGHNDSFAFGNFGSGDGSPATLRTQTLDSYLSKQTGFNPNIIRIAPAAWKQRKSCYKSGGTDDDKISLTANNASNLFRALFGVTLGTAAALGDSEYRGVIDSVMEDYKRVLPKLGADDRAVFQEHIDTINDLDKATGSGGGNGSGPDSGSGATVTANQCGPLKETDYVIEPTADEITREFHNQMRIVAQAIKCGITQLAMVNVRAGRSLVDGMTYTDTGGDTSIHSASHNSRYSATSIDPTDPASEVFSLKRLLGAHQWTAENVFLKAFQQLDTAGANGQSFMKNGAIVWTQENSMAHSTDGIPVAVMTKRPDLAAGRMIDYSDYTNPRRNMNGQLSKIIDGVSVITNHNKPFVPGASYRRFLVSLVDSMGYDGSLMPTEGADGVANPFNPVASLRFNRCNEGLPDSHFRTALTKFKV